MPLLKKPKLLQRGTSTWIKDVTWPTLSTVTFSSNNSTSTLAKVWNVVTLAFVPSEEIYSVIVSIAGKNIVPTQINPLSYTVSYTMLSDDTNWTVPFTIDFKDVNGVSTQVTATTGSEIVTFDKTAPTLASATRTGDTTLNVVLSELAITGTITKANAGGFTVFRTWSPWTTYAVSSIAPWIDNTHVVLTVANVWASSLIGLTVAYTAGGNGTVTDLAWNVLATNWTGVEIPAWDAVPTMLSATRQSNTVLFVTLSENANDATLTQANDGGFLVKETGTPATAYVVSATAKQGSNSNIVELTVANMVASAAAGVTVTYSSDGNGIIADQTANEMATDTTGVVVAPW